MGGFTRFQTIEGGLAGVPLSGTDMQLQGERWAGELVVMVRWLPTGVPSWQASRTGHVGGGCVMMIENGLTIKLDLTISTSTKRENELM